MIGWRMIGLKGQGFTSKECPVQKSSLQSDLLGMPLSTYSRIILGNVFMVQINCQYQLEIMIE